MHLFVQLIVSLILAIALAPKQKKPPPPPIEQVEGPISDEGDSIPVVFGTVYLEQTCMVWYGDQRVEELREEVDKK